MASIVETLRERLGSDAVLDRAAAAQRACSYWDPSPLRVLALLRPRDTGELSTALKICHAAGQPVVAHGGLTGVVGGDHATANDVVISLERMNRIEEIDPVGRTATAQAGVVLQTFQQAVSERGLYFPLDLGARGSCTLGGNVATNAGGINVIRFGMMRERVLGLEAVLADGVILSSMNRMLKNNAGYDLKQLFIGTEGTLGIVSRVVLRLEEPPASRNSAIVALNDFDAVIALLKFLQRRLGGQLSAFEVMWGDYFRSVTAPGWQRAPLGRDFNFYVMLEAEGGNADSDAAQFNAALEQAQQQNLLADAVLPRSEAERRALWEIREDFSALMQVKPVFIYDVSLPIGAMAGYVAEVAARLKRRWPNGSCWVFGHIGDGNLHLFVHPAAPGERLHEQSDEDVYEPLRPIGGSVSAEHGIGTEKRRYLPISRSAAEIELMRTLKRSLDPKNILNRGKVVGGG